MGSHSEKTYLTTLSLSLVVKSPLKRKQKWKLFIVVEPFLSF